MTSAGSAEVARALSHPARFAYQMLGTELWPIQIQIADSVVRNRRTSVAACTTSGKTFLEAALALWWVARYEDGIVVVISTTGTQLEEQFFAYLEILSGQARDLGRIDFPEITYAKAPRMKIGPSRYILGRAPRHGEGLGGFHEGHVLAIKDEASGLRPFVHEGVEGILSGGHAREAEFGNPLSAGTGFHKHHTTEAAVYNRFSISAFDTPNLAFLLEGIDPKLGTLDREAALVERLLATPDDEILAHVVNPKLTSALWVKDRAGPGGWGIGHPLWEARVGGRFPDEDKAALVPMAWWDRAEARARIDEDVEECWAGIDVAGPGDDETVLVIRQGRHVVLVQAWESADPRGEVLAALAPYRPQLQEIRIDAVGMGYYFAQHVRDQGYPVREVSDQGNPARDSARFRNRRAEQHWGLRERFQDDEVSGIMDPVAAQQGGYVRWKLNAKGQIELPTKDQMRSEGFDSPDRLESYVLCFMPEGGQHGQSKRWQESKGVLHGLGQEF